VYATVARRPEGACNTQGLPGAAHQQVTCCSSITTSFSRAPGALAIGVQSARCSLGAWSSGSSCAQPPTQRSNAQHGEHMHSYIRPPTNCCETCAAMSALTISVHPARRAQGRWKRHQQLRSANPSNKQRTTWHANALPHPDAPQAILCRFHCHVINPSATHDECAARQACAWQVEVARAAALRALKAGAVLPAACAARCAATLDGAGQVHLVWWESAAAAKQREQAAEQVTV
jgi:hypothetical protein